MLETLESELRELVRRFNEAKIEYALRGGMAVALHGYPRFTEDIDFLIPREWTQRQWFDWNGLHICAGSRLGLIEMKLAAVRDIDRIDIKHLRSAENE